MMRVLLAGALLLGGCAGASHHEPLMPQQAMAAPSRAMTESIGGQGPLQCVPYARENSLVKIYGDAWTWWDQAAGRYERGAAPSSGTVMVLHNYAGPKHGHLAVVRRIVSAREIRIDHANWLNDGSVYVNNPVVDVSAANDWSQVRVFNIQTGAWGGRTYPVRGFIGAARPAPPAETMPIDTLIATLAASAPPADAARPAARPASAMVDDRNPPAHSPFALTAADLAIE